MQFRISKVKAKLKKKKDQTDLKTVVLIKILIELTESKLKLD